MENKVEDRKFQFFFSQFEFIRTVYTSESSRVELVYYEPRQTVCVLKTYYHRDLSQVYQKLKFIRHENLVAVYDVLFCNDNTYVVEENIDGITLEKYLQIRGAFQEEDAIRIVKKVCGALRMLHCQVPALIHRDIKPGNVMMREDGTVKLIDFDTARYYKRKEERDTVLLGTREYASPEHFGYGQTDISSDIYSIGVMMHELLTGEIPVNHRIAYKGRLLPVLNRCIQTNPRKRFQSVQELQEVLSSYEKPWGVLFRNKKKLGVCIMRITGFFILAGILRKKLKAGLEQVQKNKKST